MNDDALSKALAAATEAADDSRQLELVKAVLTAQAISQAMQPHTCQHDHQQPKPFDARKWWTIGAVVTAGGCVACALALAFAMATIAVAIAATCATGCFLILRALWRDYLNGR
jgi:ferric-dicitrate binding protein FerR (iron transport regulator)